MIRINLLGLKKEVARAAVPTVTVEGAKVTVIFVVIVALALGVLFWHYQTLSKEADDLARKLAELNREKTELAQIKAEYDQFEKRKQSLTRRINIIEGLKAGQTGPVSLLSSLASTVNASEHLWLTNFVTDGLKVNLDGVAGNVNTVADFIANLKRSGQFKTVEIRESFQDDKFKDISAFVFSITAERVPPAPAQPASGSPSKT